MINKIGETAGSIYRTLEAQGALSINKLKDQINTDVFTTQAAIGWLAREDKIVIQKKGRSILISLK
ncbi:hypothetical protein DRI50_02430 [candidate division KSB1 bacterium]|jgi:hypothetical protein|nr:MAG: hypothetical protein DRI50_02430 [candidate division KSB1 bacterium]